MVNLDLALSLDIPSISIDYGALKNKSILTIDWSDLGSF
jgi:mannose-1-phosphate guanylyltransferase